MDTEICCSYIYSLYIFVGDPLFECILNFQVSLLTSSSSFFLTLSTSLSSLIFKFILLEELIHVILTNLDTTHPSVSKNWKFSGQEQPHIEKVKKQNYLGTRHFLWTHFSFGFYQQSLFL